MVPGIAKMKGIPVSTVSNSSLWTDIGGFHVGLTSFPALFLPGRRCGVWVTHGMHVHCCAYPSDIPATSAGWWRCKSVHIGLAGSYRELLEPSVCVVPWLQLMASNLKASKVESHHCKVDRRKGEKECMPWKSDYFMLGFTQKAALNALCF